MCAGILSVCLLYFFAWLATFVTICLVGVGCCGYCVYVCCCLFAGCIWGKFCRIVVQSMMYRGAHGSPSDSMPAPLQLSLGHFSHMGDGVD